MAALEIPMSTAIERKPGYLAHTLRIKDASGECSPFVIGAFKYNIDMRELVGRSNCFHNEGAYAEINRAWGWSNNYESDASREIFNCHFIEYTEPFMGVDFTVSFLFFSLKRAELLIPSVIKSDNQIISILRNHIMIENNLTSDAVVYYNYCIELLCRAIESDAILDLSFKGHPACKTQIHPYQCHNIAKMLEMESREITIEFSEDKLFFLPNLGLIFDYDKSSTDACFIKYSDLPKVRIYGGIIADEVGLGKTVQALCLALSKPDIKTLIVVPNHMKEHWHEEMVKHFAPHVFDGLVLITTFAEAMALTDAAEITEYGRLIVDELAELYATRRIENHKLFGRFCKLQNFRHRWGITATPFVDDAAMFNIIRFLLGNYNISRKVVGNYTHIQDAFKPFFNRNTKANVQKYLHLPDIDMHNIGLMFSAQERAILNAMDMDTGTFSIDDRLRIISNAMLELSNSDKSTITPEELYQLTVQRFQQKVDEAVAYLKGLDTALDNVNAKIKELESVEEPCRVALLLKEYNDRATHLESQITDANAIIQRRETVHYRYKMLYQNLKDIIASITERKQQRSDTDDVMGAVAADVIAMADGDELDVDADMDYNPDKCCPICMLQFVDNVVLFIACGHKFCSTCFEVCQKNNPNTCPMCRTVAQVGEINYIGTTNEVITSTKNKEIMRLLKSPEFIGERFLIFTRFDKFIVPLIHLLTSNSVTSLQLDEFKAANQSIKDETRVVVMSTNSNASGIDMTFMRNVIIIEPFDSYIYGKEIEKQVIGRVHRINQTKRVNVYRLYIRDTIEEAIYALG